MFCSRDEAFNQNLILAVFIQETQPCLDEVEQIEFVWCKNEWIGKLAYKETAECCIGGEWKRMFGLVNKLTKLIR